MLSEHSIQFLRIRPGDIPDDDRAIVCGRGNHVSGTRDRRPLYVATGKVHVYIESGTKIDDLVTLNEKIVKKKEGEF